MARANMIFRRSDAVTSRHGLPFLYGLVGTVGALSYLALLIILHVLRPELSPLKSYVSDYANGDYGSLFRSALVVHGFGNMATACGLAFVFATSRFGWWGAALFGAAAAAIILGGLFSIDPFSAPRTVTGTMSRRSKSASSASGELGRSMESCCRASLPRI